MAFSRTTALNTLYTHGWQHRLPDVPDQVFGRMALIAWMRESGAIKEQRGGLFIEMPVMYNDPALNAWVSKGESQDASDWEHTTVAKYDWKYASFPIPRFWQDDQKNAGDKTRFINHLEAKLSNAEMSMQNSINTALAAAAPSSKQIVGLQRIVADDPTASVSIGDLNQSTYSWWQNQATDMTGLSFQTNFVPKLRNLMNTCRNTSYGTMPDVLIGGQTVHERYEATLDDRLRFGSERMVDLGFHNILFNGAPFMWDDSVANTRCYALNTRFLNLYVDPAFFFRMTDWVRLPNHPNDWVTYILLACAFVTNHRRAHGVLHTIDTD